MLRIIISAFILHFFVIDQLYANTISVDVGLDTKWPRYEDTSALLDVAAALSKKNYSDCAKLIKRIKTTKIQNWLISQRLECLLLENQKNPRGPIDELRQLLLVIVKDPDLLMSGAQAKKLKNLFAESQLRLIERDLAKNRDQAWVGINRLLNLRELLTNKQQARLNFFAGEASFLNQNRQAAREYMERSYLLDPNSEVQRRLEVVQKTLNEKRSTVEARPTQISQTSIDETEIYKRMQSMQESGDFVAAVEDGVKLLQKYPGSKNSNEVAKKLLSIYVAVAAKSDDTFRSIRERIVKEMKKVDGQRLFDWSQALNQREYFSDSSELAIQSLTQLGGQPFSAQVLLLAGLSSYHTGDLKIARAQFEKLIAEYADTQPAAEAQYRLGLLDIKDLRFAEAKANFEKYLNLELNEDYELSSLYWSWRVQQKLDEGAPSDGKEAARLAERLITKYPLSYYGLRARAELNSNKLVLLKKLDKSPRWTFYFTPNEKDSWDRFVILFQGGWFDAAKEEISFITEPSAPEGKLIYAYLLTLTNNYYTSADVVARLLILKPEYFVKDVLSVTYPFLYDNLLKTASDKYKIPKFLMLGLMRQESSFRTHVASPAGAIGLMQLMPVTAKEVGADMGIRITDPTQELIVPEINIRIGAQYLSRRIRTFDGSVPLALASYNAGIGNVRNWLRSRTDLANLSKTHSSDPFQELWFDELPWAETSGYIKSILRNYMVYRLLDKGEVDLLNPIWSESVAPR